MKFTHGLWGQREHTAIYNSVEVASVSEPQPGTLKVLCATRHVENRGNTLNQPTITLNVSAPAPDIISCTATHFRGARSKEPRFDLFPGAAPQVSHPEITLNGPAETSTVTSRSLHAVLNRSPSAFHLGFHSTETGKPLTGVGYHGIQYIVGSPSQSIPGPLDATTTIADPYYRRPGAQSNRPYMTVSLDLQVGELVYGLGERFGPLTKNGQEIDIWNEDAGTCTPYSKSDYFNVPSFTSPTNSRKAYKNIPFYFTNRGYGIFFDHSDVLSLEVQTERLAKVQVSLQGEELRWFVIHGPTPKDVSAPKPSMKGSSLLKRVQDSPALLAAYRPSISAARLVLRIIPLDVLSHGI